VNVYDLSDIMRSYGVLAEPTANYSIRFTPPLVIEKAEVDEACDVLEQSLWDLEKLNE
jgi:acetylornithine/succinyldiaminopimelate/putrescine aminotransferase